MKRVQPLPKDVRWHGSSARSTRRFTWFSSAGKGKGLQRKVKAPKKQEEKEDKGKGRPQEDELKGSLADDDSSSTTTETSNPDTEPLKEVGRWAGIGPWSWLIQH